MKRSLSILTLLLTVYGNTKFAYAQSVIHQYEQNANDTASQQFMTRINQRIEHAKKVIESKGKSVVISFETRMANDYPDDQGNPSLSGYRTGYVYAKLANGLLCRAEYYHDPEEQNMDWAICQ